MTAQVNPRARAVMEISFVVSDAERSRHFYQDVLGFEPYGELDVPGRTIRAFCLGDANVKLVELAEPPRSADHDGAVGLQHITLRVRNAAEVAAACDQGGFEVATPPSPLPAMNGRPSAGSYAIVVDPDGNHIELSEGDDWAGAPAAGAPQPGG
jgi:catechol 2,3-dioxygenase-like lactoylglutathione lyase family enzyme